MSEKGPITRTCYKHPTRETLIRCNHCEKPICLDCAVSTPTGYRCKDCIREQQKKFITTVPRDYVMAAVIALALGALGSFILYQVHFFPALLSFLLGIGAGNAIVALVRQACGKRRSPLLNKITVYAAGIGGLLPILRYLFGLFKRIFLGQYGILLSYTMFIGWGILYIAVLCATILTNMKGFSIRRY